MTRTNEKISIEQARHVAQLAHLDLSEQDLERFTGQLDAILSYVAQLEELPLDGVEGTTHVVPLTCPFREDRLRPSLGREQLLDQAPRHDGEHFIVPKIID